MLGEISTVSKPAHMVAAGLLFLAFPNVAMAHDPIFGLGPHVIYEGGVEVSSQLDIGQSGSARGLDVGLLNMSYGINPSLTIGSELPWILKKNTYGQTNGLGDLGLFSKYRFWHEDSLGSLDSMAALLKVKFNTSQQGTSTATKPTLGTGTTDVIAGLTYGHESLTWYRWASVRYRRNGHSGGKKIGDKVLVDLVTGWRPTMPEYLKPDMVWLVELNGEYGRHGSLNGTPLVNDGGAELFLSPGFMWTVRNFAVRAGVQLPVFSHLNGSQTRSNYRARLQLDWHL